MAGWNIAETLTKGMIKSESDTPNWLGLLTAGGLAIGGAFMTSGMGTIAMVISFLTLGAVGLGIGGMMSGPSGRETIDQSTVANSNNIEKIKVFAKGPDGKVAEKPVEVEKVRDHIIKKDYKKVISDQKEAFFKRVTSSTYDGGITSQKAEEIATLLALSERYNGTAPFDRLKNGTKSGRLNDQDKLNDSNGRVWNRQGFSGKGGGLLNMKLDGFTLKSMVENHGTEGVNSFADDMKFSRLISSAELTLEKRIESLHTSLKNRPEQTNRAIDGDNRNLDEMIGTYLRHYKEGNLANMDHLIISGGWWDGGYGSAKSYKGQSLNPTMERQLDELLELNAALHIQEEIYKLKEDATDIAQKGLRQHNKEVKAIIDNGASQGEAKKEKDPTDDKHTSTDPASLQEALDNAKEGKINFEGLDSAMGDAPQFAATDIKNLPKGDLAMKDNGNSVA